MELNALIGHIVPDSNALVESVFHHVQDRLASSGVLVDAANKPPDKMIATVVGNGIARMILNENPSVVGEECRAGDPNEETAYYEELVDRNVVLAAALGACVCWGREVDCPSCYGDGAPGWVSPDDQLFATYVHPAINAAKSQDTTVPTIKPKIKNGKEIRDV